MGKILLLLTNLAFPFAALGVFFGFLFSPRRKLLKSLRAELQERLGLEPPSGLPQNAVWLHCASVGEVMSMKEFITRLKKFYQKDVIITTSTAAGKETALKNPDVSRAFLVPLDFYPSARRFIRRLNPHRLFVVERELWPNLICAAGKAGVPCALVNARMSQKSANAYKLVKPLWKYVFSFIKFAALQTQEDAARYASLGMPQEKITVCGNVKYDTLKETPAKEREVAALVKKLGWEEKKIFVCGSTHPLEEEILLAAAPDLIKEGIKIIFAPRHLERKEEISRSLQKSGLRFAFLSDGSYPAHTDILCIDAMGFLQSVYSCAALTFVGGSIAPRGAHNLLEPAVLGKTVLFGKSYHNTPLTAEALLKHGGAALVDEHNFKDAALRFLRDGALLENTSAKARNTALGFKGATDKIMQVVKNNE